MTTPAQVRRTTLAASIGNTVAFGLARRREPAPPTLPASMEAGS